MKPSLEVSIPLIPRIVLPKLQMLFHQVHQGTVEVYLQKVDAS